MSLIIDNEINNKQSSYQQFHQEMIIKTEAIEDDKFDYESLFASPKLKCEDEHSSFNRSCELNNSENISSSCPVTKIEPEDLGADEVRQLQGTENLTLKEEETDIEEQKPDWDLIKGSSSNVGMFKDGLDQCESVQESELRSSERSREEQAKYNCAHCSYKINKKYNFIQHYNYHHSKHPEVYKCHECSFQTRCKMSLPQHYKYKHSRNVYKCRECSFETRYKYHLTKHYKRKHSKDAEVYKCQKCSFETTYKHNLTQHYKCIHDEIVKMYICEECSYETKYKTSLIKHYKRKHLKDAGMWKCRECSFVTKYKRNLTRHYKLKHEEVVEMYKCADCQHETKIKCDLVRHFKTVHLVKRR